MEDEPLASITYLIPPKVCSDCIHATFGPYGVYCTLFHESIMDERVAMECEQWETDHPSYGIEENK